MSRPHKVGFRVPLCVVSLEDRTVPAIAFDLADSWAFGLNVNGSPSDIATDSAGDVYLTGSFLGTVDFDPGPGTFNLVGPEPPPAAPPGDPAFVAKYSAAGNFVWAVALENTVGGAGIAVDGAGNVYATGQGIAQREGFGDGAFLVKLDAATGTLVWTREVGNTYGSGVAVDGGGNVYVIGEYHVSSQFGSTTLSNSTGYHGFVTKLDSDGNFLWAKQALQIVNPGSNIGPDPEKVTVDGAGNAYVVGRYSGTVDFDPGPSMLNLMSMGGSDIFVWKLDAAGNFVWARSMGSTDGDGGNGNGDIALDSSGNIIVAGGWSGDNRNDFDPGPGTLRLTRGHNAYVVKLSSGGSLVWGRSLPARAMAVAVDGSNNIYTTGQFGGSADFDPSKKTLVLASAGSDDVFVSKLTSAGNFADAVRMGGAGWDVGRGIAVDGSNNVVTSGQFSGTADFDPGPGTYTLTSASNTDSFVSKLTQPSALLVAGSNESAGSSARKLTLPQVRPLLREALARWRAAGVDTSGLGRINVRIADLGGTTLGLASGSTIWLDDNAAGWGWFVDRTPRSDSEFTRKGNQGEMNRMDLLTVLAHEIGHLLGHEHNEEGVMGETLDAGVRSLPVDVDQTNEALLFEWFAAENRTRNR